MLLDSPAGEIGWKIPDFSLSDFDAVPFNLADQKPKRALVIAFICNHCPYVKTIIKDFAEDAKQMQRNGIDVLAIMPNDYNAYEADSPDNMKGFAKEHDFSFPYLVDKEQSVAKSFGAVCTPEFFGFDGKLQLQYRGRLDNSRPGGKQADSKREPELINAMLAIAAGEKGPQVQLPSMGCSIKWRLSIRIVAEDPDN